MRPARITAVVGLTVWGLVAASARQAQAQGQAQTQSQTTATTGRGAAARQTGSGRQGQPARAGGGRRGAAAPATGRGALAAQMDKERRIREGVANVVRKNLGLNDEQMARLGSIDSGFADRRVKLDMNERKLRLTLTGLMSAPNANQDSIANIWDRISLTMQQRRLAVDKDERDSLAKVLTPKQRVQFGGIREQVRMLVDSATAAAAASADTTKAKPAGRRGGGLRLP